MLAHQSCPSCHSTNQREFSAEINIHFPGMKGIDIPTVFVFPTISICMDCGAGQFVIAQAEREALAGRDWRGHTDGASAQ